MANDEEQYVATTAEDGEIELRVRPGPKSKTKKVERGAPLENSEPVPLFPDLDKDARNVIAYIEVHRTTPPNEGYKGTVPANSTKEFLGRRFGNGIYNLDACNADGVCLRRVQNLTIALPPVPEATRAPSGIFESDMAGRLLERLTVEHDKAADRAKSLTTETIAATKESAATYATMIREDSKERAERDRAFFAAQQAQQAAFFQAMTTQLQQIHAQSMESMRTGFQHTIQLQQMSHDRTMQQNNPAFLFQLFERGMRIGSEMGGDDDPVTKVMGMGLAGLDKVTDMMRLQKSNPQSTLPKDAGASNGSKKPKSSRKTVNRDDVVRLARLKKLAARKGQDLEAMMSQAERMLGDMPDDESDDDDESDSGASGSAGGSDVGG